MLNAIIQYIQQNPGQISYGIQQLFKAGLRKADEIKVRRRNAESERARIEYDAAHPEEVKERERERKERERERRRLKRERERERRRLKLERERERCRLKLERERERCRRKRSNRKFLETIYESLVDSEVDRLKQDRRTKTLKPDTLVKFAKQKIPSNLGDYASSFEKQCNIHISDYKTARQEGKEGAAVRKVFAKNEAGCMAYVTAYIRIMKKGTRDDIVEMQLMEAAEENSLAPSDVKKIERLADRSGWDIDRVQAILSNDGEDARLAAIAEQIQKCKAYICAIDFWESRGEITFDTDGEEDMINSQLSDELDLPEPLQVDNVSNSWSGDVDDGVEESESDENYQESDECNAEDECDEEDAADEDDNDDSDEGGEDDNDNDDEKMDNNDDEETEQENDNAMDDAGESEEGYDTTAIAEAIHDGFCRIRNDRLFFAPGLPTDKLVNAAKSMRVRENNVCLLIDTTVWGGSREGMLLTDKAIYFKNLGDDPVRIPLDEIPKVSMDDNGDLCFGNKTLMFTSSFSKGQVRKMVEAISHAVCNANKGN